MLMVILYSVNENMNAHGGLPPSQSANIHRGLHNAALFQHHDLESNRSSVQILAERYFMILSLLTWNCVPV